MSDDLPSASTGQELTAEIVSAYLKHNKVAADQIATLISTTHRALADLGKTAVEAGVEGAPAVPIRRSVHHDYVICLDCGYRGQMLRRHLSTPAVVHHHAGDTLAEAFVGADDHGDLSGLESEELGGELQESG